MLHATEGVEEVAVVDSREDRVRSLARSYKSAPWHTALGTALDEVDAVVVATPPSTHVAVALQAIEAGKHVLVEKPLAPTSAEVRQLESAASAAGVVLMVGHTFEYNPAVRKLRELVQSEELGEVYYIDSSGMGELVRVYTSIRNQGGEMKLMNLSRRVQDLLQMTRLNAVFQIEDTQAAAIDSFRGDSQQVA